MPFQWTSCVTRCIVKIVCCVPKRYRRTSLIYFRKKELLRSTPACKKHNLSPRALVENIPKNDHARGSGKTGKKSEPAKAKLETEQRCLYCESLVPGCGGMAAWAWKTCGHQEKHIWCEEKKYGKGVGRKCREGRNLYQSWNCKMHRSPPSTIKHDNVKQMSKHFQVGKSFG